MCNTYALNGSNLAVLSQCISKSASLINLDMTSNKSITVGQWKSFIGQLSESGRLLEDLVLLNNDKINDRLLPELTLLMKASSKTKRLSLMRSGISSMGRNQLVAALQESSIECLDGMGDVTLPAQTSFSLLQYRNLTLLRLGDSSLETVPHIFNRAESPQCRNLTVFLRMSSKSHMQDETGSRH